LYIYVSGHVFKQMSVSGLEPPKWHTSVPIRERTVPYLGLHNDSASYQNTSLYYHSVIFQIEVRILTISPDDRQSHCFYLLFIQYVLVKINRKWKMRFKWTAYF